MPSASYCHVVLVGNLTRDPEIRYLQKGTAICQVTVAVNRRWKNDAGEDQEEVSFIDVDCWGRTAENVAQYLKKGASMLVDGRLRQDSWEDKETGQKRSKLKVVAQSVQFLGGKREDGGGEGGGAGGGAPASTRSFRQRPSTSDPEVLPQDDDVPF